MKKVISVILAVLVLSGLTLFGCNRPEQEEAEKEVSIKYYQDGSALLPMLIAGSETIGLLPEPAATVLENRTQGTTWYRLDLQELYDGTAKAYPQAVLMIKSSLLSAYPNLVESIVSKIEDNVSWVKDNTADAVNSIKSKYADSTLNANNLTGTCIDNCKIYSQSSANAKQSVNKYINDIRAIDQASANTVGDDFFYTAEQSQDQGEWVKENVTFYAPDGAPALAIAKFISDNESFETGKTFDYSVVAAANIVGAMATANADILLMPINGATKKYNAGGNATDPYKLVSVITHGNFYIMSKENITLAGLKDKKIGVPNMGAVPDWTFQTVLKNNNIKFKVVD